MLIQNTDKLDIVQFNLSLDPYHVLNQIGYANSNPIEVGNEIRDYCPIHQSDNQRSLCINKNEKLFHCKSCNAKGDLVGLFSQACGLKNLEARQRLESNIGNFITHNTQTKKVINQKYSTEQVINCWNNALLFSTVDSLSATGKDTYFKYKKLMPPPIAKFGTNPYNHYSTLIPFQDIEGNFKGFECRTEKDKYQYKIDDEIKFMLLGELKPEGYLYIGEGIATIQTVWEAHDREIPAVAVGSWVNFKPVLQQIKNKYPNLIPIILLDLDKESEIEQLKEIFIGAIILKPTFSIEDKKVLKEKKLEDFNDMISKDNQTLEDVKQATNIVHITPAKLDTVSFNDSVQNPNVLHISNSFKTTNIYNEIFTRYTHFTTTDTIFLSGIPTTFKKLDEMSGGIQKGHLITLGGRSGTGKSWIALNFILKLAEQGKKVALFSLEMSLKQLNLRLISLHSKIALTNINNGNLTIGDLKKLSETIVSLSNMDILLDANSTNETYEILKENIIQHIKNGIDFIVIDNIQLIYSNSRKENRTLELTEISRDLKKITSEIPILILTQLNKEAEKEKRPNKSHIKHADAINADSDIILIIDREEQSNKFTLYVDKNRDGEEGPILFEHTNWLITENAYENNNSKDLVQKKNKQNKSDNWYE